jgi:hypothetical protein
MAKALKLLSFKMRIVRASDARFIAATQDGKARTLA